MTNYPDMIRVNMAELKANLSSYMERVEGGETIVVYRRNVPIAEIRPLQKHASIPRRVGIDRGMIGLINAYASRAMAGSNAVIITHELLHTLGATDKYDPASGLPTFPQGYAEPERAPRHPQVFAEIMGGRIPLADHRADIPDSLDQTLIGDVTAGEIGWAAR